MLIIIAIVDWLFCTYKMASVFASSIFSVNSLLNLPIVLQYKLHRIYIYIIYLYIIIGNLHPVQHVLCKMITNKRLKITNRFAKSHRARMLPYLLRYACACMLLCPIPQCPYLIVSLLCCSTCIWLSPVSQCPCVSCVAAPPVPHPAPVSQRPPYLTLPLSHSAPHISPCPCLTAPPVPHPAPVLQRAHAQPLALRPVGVARRADRRQLPADAHLHDLQPVAVHRRRARSRRRLLRVLLATGGHRRRQWTLSLAPPPTPPTELYTPPPHGLVTPPPTDRPSTAFSTCCTPPIVWF